MRVVRFLSVSILASAFVLGPAVVASAHDGLLDSSPAADETVTSELTSVTLTFSDVPLAGTPAVIQVTDAAGASITAGDVTAADRSLSVAVRPTTTGVYTVVWQAVSSDAHTVSGQYSFTYSGPVPAPSPSPSEPAASEPAASATPEPSASDEVSSAAPTDTENASGTSASSDAFLPLIVAVLAAVLIAVAAAVYRSRAGKRQRTEK